MCPVCPSTAALIAGSITSTAGLAAIAIRAFSTRKHPASFCHSLGESASVAAFAFLSVIP